MSAKSYYAVAAQCLSKMWRLEGQVEKTLAEHPEMRRTLQALCFGVLRWQPRLALIAKQLLKKSFKPKDYDLAALIFIALYQLQVAHDPDYAVVNEVVAATQVLRKQWAKGLVNGVLRHYLRERVQIDAELAANPEYVYAHPAWLIQKIQGAWPEHWQAVLTANNAHPPMCLRVNLAKISREDYIKLLVEKGFSGSVAEQSSAGIILKVPTDVRHLPGFMKGLVSVQDVSAQLAAEMLTLRPGLRVLDACAAPGGKTSHLLEREPAIDLTALDISPDRVKLIKENLARLKLKAHVIVADAALPKSWWGGEPFDRILLDVPCSATGVIRRHPDIKLKRTPESLTKVTQTQWQIINAIWPLLGVGGELLYVTCSVMPEENRLLLQKFLEQTPGAQELPVSISAGLAQSPGWQLLPGQLYGDGFFYGKLTKK